jgi:hypothetical protein
MHSTQWKNDKLTYTGAELNSHPGSLASGLDPIHGGKPDVGNGNIRPLAERGLHRPATGARWRARLEVMAAALHTPAAPRRSGWAADRPWRTAGNSPSGVPP